VRVQIVVFDGFDEIDVFGPFEALSASGIQVGLVRHDAPGWAASQRGIRLEVPAVLLADAVGDENQPVDGVIVPGGGWLNRAERGAWAEVQSGALPAALRQARERVSWLASVCSGGMVLGHAGLLRGRRATTNRRCYDEFRPLVGELVDERGVDDGDVITAGALTSGLDLGLHIARRFLGDEVADRATQSLEYPPVSAALR
jgi:transcriptional regulator GlxA family with amidase domain